MRLPSLFAAASIAAIAANSAQAETISADVWADNWFAFYLNDKLVKEDSVSVTTERSFNKESFSFEAKRPFVLNIIAKDFKENDTGLEYIGTRRQQMGDGGLIAQFKDSNGNDVAVTNGDWKCAVIHQAPSDKSCEKSNNPVAGQSPCGFTEIIEPAGWKDISFDDSQWPNASVHSARAVGPKDGYDQVSWSPNAEIIWGPDLETDNTILCRLKVE